MGDVVARKEWTDYRVGPGGEPLYPFDEANPPVVPLGVEFSFLPRFTNQGETAHEVTLAAAVTGPEGNDIPPNWFLDPDYPRSIEPGTTGGIGFHFTCNVSGDYTVEYRVLADGNLSDSWTVVVCTAEGVVPPPPPDTSSWAEMIAPMMGMMVFGLVMVPLVKRMSRQEGN